MPVIIISGVILIHIAVVLYTIFIIKETKYKRATTSLLKFITTAVVFDILATGCMMIGTAKEYFTLHGILGYTALFLMIIDTILIWRHKINKGSEEHFSTGLDRYSKFAYVIWILAFITGEYLAIVSH